MIRILSLSIFAAFAILSFISSVPAQFPIAGEVIDVIDGKTVLVAIPNGHVKVELQYIDVPEQGQELHDTVKEHLRNLVIGKLVEYRPRTLFNDRAIGRLTMRDIDVSQQMLRDGAAWHVPMQVSGQASDEYTAYASFEAAAKNEKRGVWSIPGLRPAWEVRAENLEIARQRQQSSWTANSGSRYAGNNASARKATTNPSFGDVGALLNRYDPESKTGFLSTSYMPITVGGESAGVERMAVDVTYYYKEGRRQERTGTFVVSVAFLSKKAQFLANNDLQVWDNGKVTNIGKPRRLASEQGGDIRETLIYQMSRSMLERAANNEGVFLKVGHQIIHLTGARYLLYNMLQVTK